MSATEPSALGLTAEPSVVQVQLDFQVDYNEAAKTVVSTALGAIPYVGAPLGALVTIFWPSSERDVWAEIAGRVEALVDEKISELVWQETVNTLTGLQAVLDDYLGAVEWNDPSIISIKWNVANGLFIHDRPIFQSKGHELLLLPLFAQFANLHLFLFRDGVKFGATWGWNPAAVQGTAVDQAEAIDAYGSYTQKIYEAALGDVVANAPTSPSHIEPFNTINTFKREMQRTVLDFALTWPYFDAIKYPDPVEVQVTREIYSQAVGTAHDTGLSLPANPPSGPITKIIVSGWDRIDAAQVEYPAGGGPDGVTSTGRMGNRRGGSDTAPWGGTFEIAQTGPVVKVKTLSGDILHAFWLTFESGATSQQLGGKYPGGGPSEFTYPGEILSSIKIMGASQYYGSANCAVFGFKYPNERFPVADAAVARAFFVGDPARRSASQLAADLGIETEECTEVARWAEVNGWDVLREVAAAARKRRLEQRESERA
jgi:hypothetical protein